MVLLGEANEEGNMKSKLDWYVVCFLFVYLFGMAYFAYHPTTKVPFK